MGGVSGGAAVAAFICCCGCCCPHPSTQRYQVGEYLYHMTIPYFWKFISLYCTTVSELWPCWIHSSKLNTAQTHNDMFRNFLSHLPLYILVNVTIQLMGLLKLHWFMVQTAYFSSNSPTIHVVQSLFKLHVKYSLQQVSVVYTRSPSLQGQHGCS